MNPFIVDEPQNGPPDLGRTSRNPVAGTRRQGCLSYGPTLACGVILKNHQFSGQDSNAARAKEFISSHAPVVMGSHHTEFPSRFCFENS
jgi:hypothetical protein